MSTPSSQHLWHTLSAADTLQAFSVKPEKGLPQREVALRLARFGPNQLQAEKKDTIFKVFARQFRNPLLWVLVGALGVTLFLQEWVDAIVIAIALVINLAVGTVQEWKASEAFETLRKEIHHEATVRRAGEIRRIPAETLVPGDIILLNEGDIVPADSRLIRAKDIRTNEAILTGEWMDVEKDPAAIALEDAPLAERKNMVWAGTTISQGEGEAVVVATGMRTQIGRIAEALSQTEEVSTPLERGIRRIATMLTIIIFGMLFLLLTVGLWRGYELDALFLTAVAIAVAAIPQGLPAAVTVTLALGMREILNKRGLVRNLLAAETLGSTSVIITDKTGTLTQAKMQLKEIVGPEVVDRTFFKVKDAVETKALWPLKGAVMASDAFLEKQDDGSFRAIGRPLECAILTAGLEEGITQAEILVQLPRIDEIPFRSSRKYRATLHTVPGEKLNLAVFVGAPEVLLEAASSFGDPHQHKAFSPVLRASWEQILASHTQKGKRVIAVAFAHTAASKLDPTNPIPKKGVIFGGLLAFEDPLRPDVPDAIREVVQAGVEVIMATGDNPATAQYIATAAGIPYAERGAITGPQIDKMDDAALKEALRSYRVFARVTPEHKLRMVRLLQEEEEIVAMTGDGVNDAPALRQANIGVAVGSGTEVAKAASDLILLDNSFRIIVSAIRVGRRIMDNIKKIIVFLISTNFSGISLVGSSVVAGTPLPILARQLLWTNIVEEGFMSFAYSFEPEEPDSMRRSPKSVALRSILTPALLRMIIIIPVVTSAMLIALYFYLYFQGYDLDHLRSIMFVALVLDSLLFAFSLKSLRRPLWRIRFTDNRFLLIALAISTLLLFLAFALPPLRNLLALVSLDATMVAALALLGLGNLAVIELGKYLFIILPHRRRKEVAA